MQQSVHQCVDVKYKKLYMYFFFQMNMDKNPVEAGLMSFVDMNKVSSNTVIFFPLILCYISVNKAQIGLVWSVPYLLGVENI